MYNVINRQRDMIRISIGTGTLGGAEVLADEMGKEADENNIYDHCLER